MVVVGDSGWVVMVVMVTVSGCPGDGVNTEAVDSPGAGAEGVDLFGESHARHGVGHARLDRQPGPRLVVRACVRECVCRCVLTCFRFWRDFCLFFEFISR